MLKKRNVEESKYKTELCCIPKLHFACQFDENYFIVIFLIVFDYEITTDVSVMNFEQVQMSYDCLI